MKPIGIFLHSVSKYITALLFTGFFWTNIAFADPSIVNIDVQTRGRLVTMSASLLNGLTDSILEAIHSGIPVTFTYQIELVQTIPLWADKVVSRNTISNTIQYDSLKKAYRFSSIGRNVQQRVVTKNINRYKTLMTALKNIPIASIKKIDYNQTYFIRVKADVETDRFWFPFNYIFFFVPFNDVKTSWAESSPLVWKPEIQQVSDPGGRKNSKKHIGRPGIMKHEAIRTFNQ